ncbi:MAG: hypothetical protein J0M04_16020 [Verrucomicrobia bacterium]|nr:hypothetical protein [Verrucomicrobiota bacterium]
MILFRNEQNQWSFQFRKETEESVRAISQAEHDLRKQEGLPTSYERELKATRYKMAGKIIATVLEDPEVKLIGHHFSADAVMIEHWLGIDTYGRCIMDTEFAQQTVDESSELDLERGIAMKYTTLGFYSQDLIEWKRANKKLCENGYGYIPESIIVPYACLAWDSKVQLGDGSWELIHKLVQERYTGDVMALVDGKVKPCKVTNWKKTKRPGQRWYRVVAPGFSSK